MTPRELKQVLRQRRKDFRAAAQRTQAAARERLGRNPALVQARKERNRRRARRTAEVGLLVLLLCFIRCECGKKPATPEVKKAALPTLVKPRPPPLRASKPKSIHAQVASQPRGAFPAGAPASPTWLDAFRLQVAARSPRLAQCFTGADRPGALRWTSSVNPESGKVSDHELELLGASSDLSGEQRECLLRTLSAPPYRLPRPVKADPQALPSRIGIALEF